MGKSIGIISIKGGVGKTSVVAALGSAFAEFNKKVLLVDANFSSPNLGIHLNVINPRFTIHHVLDNIANVKNAIYKLEKFDVLPASIFYKGNISPLKLKDKISLLKRQYDIILIDSSPALNEETLAAMLASDEIFVVTTPDFPTLSTTLKAIKIAKQRGTPISGLILNKVYNKKFELSLENIENTAEVPIMAVIPYDVCVLKALSNFTSSTDYKPKSEGSEEYKKLAAVLLGEQYKPARLRNLFGWISPKKQDINRVIFYDSVFG